LIRVTRLDQSEFYLNAEFIQSVESTPDTHIVLFNGHSYVVKESDHEVVDRIIRYRRSVYGGGGAAPYLRVVEG
jgi:flagellar protein FlbD